MLLADAFLEKENMKILQSHLIHYIGFGCIHMLEIKEYFQDILTFLIKNSDIGIQNCPIQERWNHLLKNTIWYHLL